MFLVYSTPNCPYCHRAKELLESRHQTFEEINVLESDEAMELFAGWRVKTVPQIVHNNVHIGGYEDLVKYMEADGES